MGCPVVPGASIYEKEAWAVKSLSLVSLNTRYLKALGCRICRVLGWLRGRSALKCTRFAGGAQKRDMSPHVTL
jgi:hypothetical protein